jgi:hypothetical protein
MKQSDFNITAIVSGFVVGILSLGLGAGLIKYSFIAWLLINIAWWGSIAFAGGFCLALGAYVAIRLVERTDGFL